MNKLSELICGLVCSQIAFNRACSSGDGFQEATADLHFHQKAIDEWEMCLKNPMREVAGMSLMAARRIADHEQSLIADKPSRNKLQEAIVYAQKQFLDHSGRLDGQGNAKREAYCDMITRLESLDRENE
jgi:hypothetical protein